ncbi:hypothetical protein B566_EDAN003905 [Ephemera danica]|nr:hypothetical protein B566_EDAN003905 [Ephemera danica]
MIYKSSVFCYILFFTVVEKIVCDKINFNFPEYIYKETTKNEVTFQEFELACQQSPECHSLAGITRDNCIRQCVSPTCYQDIYKADELEDGEIDVRLNSFKGCFTIRGNRQRP